MRNQTVHIRRPLVKGFRLTAKQRPENGGFHVGRVAAGRVLMFLGQWADVERQGGLDIAIDGEVDLVLAVLFELKVLDVQDQIDRDSGRIIADADRDIALELGTDGIAVSVNDENADAVVAGLDLRKADAGGNAACPVANGGFFGEDIVKRAQHIQLAPLVCRGVAQQK